MEPKVGDWIYVPPTDTNTAGKARISRVYTAVSGGELEFFVQTESTGDRGFNWKYLNEDRKQIHMSNIYGDQVAVYDGF